jgi:NDP-sugar pyrophosphorylase family protein
MQAVILAAGRGSRLNPITIKRSKAMLPILGKPIVARVIESIAACQIRNFILVVNSKDEDIMRYFRQQSDLDVEITFVHQPERKGMADALQHAAPHLHQDFVLSACDNLVSDQDVQRMLAMWRSQPQLNAVLALMKVPYEQIRKSGIVHLQGDLVTHIVEKPDPDQAPSDIASLPLYCFSQKLLDYLPLVKPSPRGEFELQDAIEMLIQRDGGVKGCMVQRRLTLTTAADLLAINQDYLRNGMTNRLKLSAIAGEGTRFTTPLYIEDGTTIGSGCVIGPNVYIEGEVQIGNDVVLQDAVVLHGSVVPSGAHIANQVVS